MLLPMQIAVSNPCAVVGGSGRVSWRIPARCREGERVRSHDEPRREAEALHERIAETPDDILAVSSLAFHRPEG